MEIIIIFILMMVIIIFAVYQNQKKKEYDQQILIITDLFEQANECFNEIDKSKTITTKLKNCKNALYLLERAGLYEHCREVIENYDELIDRIKRVEKVLPIGDYLSKAQKHRFKTSDKSEKSTLLDALYEIKTNNITDKDFVIANLHDQNTGDVITTRSIESRLKELGWED